MADSPPDPKKYAPGSAGDWEFLYGRSIPFKHELHVFLWHLPGIVAAVAIGVAVNMTLEEILKRVSKRVAEHALVRLVWIALLVYLIFFTGFDTWVATQIHWYKIVPYPYGRAR